MIYFQIAVGNDDVQTCRQKRQTDNRKKFMNVNKLMFASDRQLLIHWIIYGFTVFTPNTGLQHDLQSCTSPASATFLHTVLKCGAIRSASRGPDVAMCTCQAAGLLDPADIQRSQVGKLWPWPFVLEMAHQLSSGCTCQPTGMMTSSVCRSQSGLLWKCRFDLCGLWVKLYNPASVTITA